MKRLIEFFKRMFKRNDVAPEPEKKSKDNLEDYIIALPYVEASTLHIETLNEKAKNDKDKIQKRMDSGNI